MANIAQFLGCFFFSAIVILVAESQVLWDRGFNYPLFGHKIFETLTICTTPHLAIYSVFKIALTFKAISHIHVHRNRTKKLNALKSMRAFTYTQKLRPNRNRTPNRKHARIGFYFFRFRWPNLSNYDIVLITPARIQPHNHVCCI